MATSIFYKDSKWYGRLVKDTNVIVYDLIKALFSNYGIKKLPETISDIIKIQQNFL